MYWTKINVSKKRHRYNDEFNIILTSEMLVWNCFRLLTAKFTTISFTMPLEREMKYHFLLKTDIVPWRSLYDHNMETWEPGIICCTLDEQHIQVYLTFPTLQTMWKLFSYHRTTRPITLVNIELNLTKVPCHCER